LNKLRTNGSWYFYLLFCASLALTWFFHKDSTRFTDRNELWSDRAGYYIYLPATFFYHFDTHKMPADLDIATGGGFSIDTVTNKLDTKYTYGVSLMVSPLFFTAAVVSRIAGIDDENGFSMLYMRMMSLAAVIYMVLGMWLLKKFLDFYFRPAIGFFVITLVFLGTNLFIYSLLDGMMSHVYSFFLFALFLYTLKRYLLAPTGRLFLLLCLSLSLAVLIRPTNILLALLFFSWDGRPGEWIARVKNFMKPSQILVFSGIILLLFVPQMIYWKYLSGHWLHFSYQGEGFTNWRHPRIAEVLFSPVNGLFAYVPLTLLFVAGIILMLFRKMGNGLTIAAVFIVLTLVCASWKMWYFGCCNGQRSYIEYYTILAVPFGYLATELFRMRNFVVSSLLLFIILLPAYYTQRYTLAMYRFERCYYGSTWDWDHFSRSLGRAGIIARDNQVRSYENDFENMALSPVVRPSMLFTRSGRYSIAAREKGGQTPIFSIRLDEFGHPWPKTMEVEVWALKPGAAGTGAALCYTLKRGADLIFSDEQPVDSVVTKPLTWSKVGKNFIIPDVTDSSMLINIYIRNPKYGQLYVDDLHIKYRYSWN